MAHFVAYQVKIFSSVTVTMRRSSPTSGTRTGPIFGVGILLLSKVILGVSTMKRIKTSFESVTGNLASLGRDELAELRDMIETLLALQVNVDEEQPEELAAAQQSKRTAAGHVEAKTINGCGPYLYLRYWSGKTLKSKYIGKANAALAA
jgi:hypothetical protein